MYIHIGLALVAVIFSILIASVQRKESADPKSLAPEESDFYHYLQSGISDIQKKLSTLGLGVSLLFLGLSLVFALKHLLGALDRVRVTHFLELADDEWLVELECDLLGREEVHGLIVDPGASAAVIGTEAVRRFFESVLEPKA